jgi:hypothetical protein
LLGPALEKVGGFFKSLFGGVSADVQKARTEVAAFQAELAKTATETQRNEAAMSGWGDRGALTLIRVRDALIAIGRSGSEADALVRALWDTDRPDRARRAMEEINRILEAQEQQLRDNEAAVESLTGEMEGLQAELTALRAEGEITWEKMREAANRYGIDLAALGPAFQSGRLHESAQQIFDDFVLLTRGGADVGGVLLGMKDDIIQLAQESVRFGVQIPENFRPLIENLIRSEELTEDEKAALRALGEENFGDPIVAHLDEIATRMGELITRIGEVADMLARNLAGAARDAGREIGRVGDEGRAAAGAIDYEFRARAIPALQDTAEAIEDVIQMQSPTGLEGIIHYARLAGAALFGMAQNGVVDIRQLKRTIDDTAGSVAGLSTILAPLDNSKSALPPLDASKQVPTVDASAFTVGAGAFAPPPTISASPNFMGFINGVQTYDFLGLKPMAEGGRGIVTRPTLFLAGERGPEEYAFSGANRQFESAGATNVYFAIDKDGSGRQVSDAEFFERIQRGANELRFTIPARGIRERAA